MRIESEVKLDYKDVLIRPKRSRLESRSQVDLHRSFTFLHSPHQWSGIPIMAANMDTTGTFEVAEVLSSHHVVTVIHKAASLEAWREFGEKHADALPYVAVSAGAQEKELEHVSSILEMFPQIQMICLDVANGYTEVFVEQVRRTRKRFPEHILIAGNVVTGEMTEELLLSGADIVKVGIGPGSVCTTRVMTGVGYPQLSAVIECADAAHGLGGWIIGDGGCTAAGDLAKAFGGGADFVMLGGMFAGHIESAQEVVHVDGKAYARFYGMSSETANAKYAGGLDKYRASEGREVLLPLKGSLHDTVQEVLGGLRSSCTYVGAKTLKELHKRTTFIRVSRTVNEVFSRFDHK